MVYRIYVEKKPELANEAGALLSDVRTLLGISSLEHVRILNRYDAENISEDLFQYAVKTVFSEPQLDLTYSTLDVTGCLAFAVEYLPGQFDQRADSAAQCIQIISQGDRPTIQSAKIYLLYGNLSDAELAEIKKYVINPVEAREAEFALPDTLLAKYDIPEEVETLCGLRDLKDRELEAAIAEYGLAMDMADLAFCQEYFRRENRDPTITELRMIDTYWSDHCRHTTFLTSIDSAVFEDSLLDSAYQNYLQIRSELGRTGPVTLMDLATVAVKYLKSQGKLDKLDESEEINACTVKIEVEADGIKEPWLLLFKNETHNHPTEIEPFGGAATCVGGAIRDPLSGRGYVYGAMRLTGAADPTVPVRDTIPGKLPQRKIVTTAAAGYSSYGNQIGLATGIVDELYHPGYAAKRMEIGAVIAAAPVENVRRETPVPGDIVILLGGRTGRDGIGGATGASKAHNVTSVETCGAEVQKGNAPEERKLQRLFRNGNATRLIKRCNDFGAGGVSVAIGELADGLDIDLNAVPKKYEGLDGTEIAISESQERMAVVVAADDVQDFLDLAEKENLEATPVARVTSEPRLIMRWNGKPIVDISREFLSSNGAEKHISVAPESPQPYEKTLLDTFKENMTAMVSDLNCCSHRGLSERFDSTIGAGTVLMPFGGKYQLTPIQAMVQKIPMEQKKTDDCSLMSWGFNPYISEKSPFHSAYLAVIESVSKLIACGTDYKDIYLTFQEYFEKPGSDSHRWGKPFAALLGAFRAQTELELGAIGGKDSMSGSFEDLDVPPTLVSFAVTTDKTDHIISPEFKEAGHPVILLRPEYGPDRLPVAESQKALYQQVHQMLSSGYAVSCYTPGIGGPAEAIFKMCLGNGFGFRFNELLSIEDLFHYAYGAFVLELSDPTIPEDCTLLGMITQTRSFTFGTEAISSGELLSLYEDRLENVFSCNIPHADITGTDAFSFRVSNPHAPSIHNAKPKVLIPVFPGTNCEYDSARAMREAGADPEIIVINNLTASGISRSVEQFAAAVKGAQMIMIPGGFSGGDEPDGSGKFITAFFRNAAVKESVTELLDSRDGLMCGICNGFQALIKLGLVPYGRIIDTDENCPTLTYNVIGRHQSKIVRTRVASDLSPWLRFAHVGDIYTVPISHGEGRFLADEALIRQLAENGQIATQYVDFDGKVTGDIRYNPNSSLFGIEGITSPDGRVIGKMGHSERIGRGLYKNVPGEYEIRMFEAAVAYYK